MSIDGIRRMRQSNYALPQSQKLVPVPVPVYARADQFVPPSQMESQDYQQANMPASDPNNDPSQELPPPPKRSFKQWLAARTKKQWIIFGTILVLLIGGGAAAFVMLGKEEPPKPTPKVVKSKPAPPPPTTEASYLTGVQVGFDVNKRPVTAVMIENSQDARPQSGLDAAGVVFEAVAEGGITRFLAIFQDSDPAYIGPVRSVRPYYLHWALGFDAAIAHAGGSAEALASIGPWGVKDLNHDSAHFYRISSRFAPHNLYTDITKLRDYAAQKGFGTSKYTGFLRRPEAPAKTPTARVISMNISSAAFNASFTYDPATNSYARSLAGSPHMVVDGAGVQTQLKPKVVVGLLMAQGNNGIYTTYASLGSGTAFVFQDGTVTEAVWNKPDRNTNITFTDKAGKPLKLVPGQTWITALGGPDRISWTP